MHRRLCNIMYTKVTTNTSLALWLLPLRKGTSWDHLMLYHYLVRCLCCTQPYQHCHTLCIEPRREQSNGPSVDNGQSSVNLNVYGWFINFSHWNATSSLSPITGRPKLDKWMQKILNLKKQNAWEWDSRLWPTSWRGAM